MSLQKISFWFLILGLTLSVAACDLISVNTGNKPSTSPSSTARVMSGEASYYADRFHGRSTASGEKYDKNKLTAAHKTLPFQTKLEVKNLKNGKKVVVRINDRMPASSKRVIDLSEAAAKQINMISDGVVQVEMRIID